MNIFKKIGNAIEKQKKEKERIENKYWKLSPLERMDYDQKIDRINYNSNESLFHFYFTKLFLFLIGIWVIIVLLMSFGANIEIIKLIERLRSLSFPFAKLILIGIVADVLTFLINLIYYDNNRSKKIKEINKRFKLC